MNVGRIIFFDIVDGSIIVNTNEYSGVTRKKTIDEQIATYPQLSERNRESFDYIELEYGQYHQDFMECIGYSVNPETKELNFKYPDPNEPEVEQPYRPPLSEEIETLKSNLDTAIIELSMAMAMRGGYNV